MKTSNCFAGYKNEVICDGSHRQFTDEVILGLEEAMNDGEAYGFKRIECPVCRCVNAHVRIEPVEVNTRQGGALISISYECGHSNTEFVIAEHKGVSVFGEVVSGYMRRGEVK